MEIAITAVVSYIFKSKVVIFQEKVNVPHSRYSVIKEKNLHCIFFHLAVNLRRSSSTSMWNDQINGSLGRNLAHNNEFPLSLSKNDEEMF